MNTGAAQPQPRKEVPPSRPPVRSRLCTRCLRIRAASYFYARNWTYNNGKRYLCPPGTLQGWCRDCRRAYYRDRSSDPAVLAHETTMHRLWRARNRRREKINRLYCRWATVYPMLAEVEAAGKGATEGECP